MRTMKSQDYLARWYEKGGSEPLPISMHLDGGEILASDGNGNTKTFPFDDWEMKLGGTREDRVVLKSNTTGETIIADLKLMDAIAAGTRYPLLTKQAKKLKSGGMMRSIRQSTGMIFVILAILAFLGLVALGILGSSKDGPVTRSPHEQSETTETGTGTQTAESEPGDTTNMPTEDYMKMIQKRIKHNWHPRSHKASEAIVIFDVHRDGSISNARMKETSGDKALDRITVEAVNQSSPLPTLPSQIEEPAEIKFTFKVNAKER